MIFSNPAVESTQSYKEQCKLIEQIQFSINNK